jgi:hypothetical protein
VSPIDTRAAADNRDSLAKTLYSRMFDWLVAKVNTSIGQDPAAVSLVGVLDIYGARPLQQFLNRGVQDGHSYGSFLSLLEGEGDCWLRA